MEQKTMVKLGVSILAGAALGTSVWLLLRSRKKDGVVEQIEVAADEACHRASNIARTLKEKAMPVIRAIGELVEQNAELVSSITKLNVNQVRKSGHEILQTADTLDKGLAPFASN